VGVFFLLRTTRRLFESSEGEESNELNCFHLMTFHLHFSCAASSSSSFLFCERKTLAHETIRVKMLSKTTFSTPRMTLVTANSKIRLLLLSSFYFIFLELNFNEKRVLKQQQER